MSTGLELYLQAVNLILWTNLEAEAAQACYVRSLSALSPCSK